MFDVGRGERAEPILHSALRLQEGDGRMSVSPDQYFILAPEEMQMETFCLSQHQNTNAVFPFLPVRWKIHQS